MAGEIVGTVLAIVGWAACALIGYGLLYGVARHIEKRTRLERPRLAPIEAYGDVINLPHEAKAATGTRKGRGGDAPAERRQPSNSHSSRPRTGQAAK